MNWKEFFKPTIWKITLAIIIFILFYSIIGPAMDKIVPFACLKDAPCGWYTLSFFRIFSLRFISLSFTVLVQYLIFLSELIISYTLSCSIISSKIMKRKNENKSK